jgi:hydrogenase maturation protease
MQALLLGVGNILLQDEGVGVRAVEALQQRYHLPPEVEVLDGGTASMGLIEYMLGKTHVLIVDAIKLDQPPGTIVRLEDEEVPVFLQTHLTPHQLGLSDVLATLAIADRKPQRIVLLGIVPQSLELDLDLSELIARKLVDLVERMVAELRNMGFHLSPK